MAHPESALAWRACCSGLGKLQLKSKIVRSASLSTLPSAYDAFLYAAVGESANGAPLTVLSVLARQNVDPWEEAADLSRMPRDTAARKLISMITASPGRSSTDQSSTDDRAALAGRLIALLPQCIAAVNGTPKAPQGEAVVQRSPQVVNWMVITIYIGVIVLTQWIAADIFEKPPAHVAAQPSPLPATGETSREHRRDN